MAVFKILYKIVQTSCRIGKPKQIDLEIFAVKDGGLKKYLKINLKVADWPRIKLITFLVYNHTYFRFIKRKFENV